MKSKSDVTPTASQRTPIRWADLFKVTLALVLIGIVLSKTNLQQLAALQDMLDWRWFWFSFFLYCVMTLIKSLQYWMLLQQKVAFDQTLKIVVIQNGLANLVANTAGLASYLAMFRLEQNVKLSRSGTAFVITKVGDVFSMGLFLLMSAWFVWDRVVALQSMIVLLLMAIFGAVAFFWTVVFLRRNFVSQIEKLLNALRIDRFALVQRVLGFLRSLAEAEQAVVVPLLTKGLLLSVVYMTLTMLYVYSRTQIFHIPLDFWGIIFIAALMQLVSIIPMQVFGGLGVTEVTSLYLYELMGVTGVDISAIVIGLRVVFYLFNLGVLFYLPADILVKKLSVSKSVNVE